jgi:predicted TIM-barrel fold metal-dependent hydrolase
MFGSDWPVWIDAMRYVVSDLSREEQDSIFGGNAVRVYDLKG